ncbi:MULTISPECIES: hypothetical protein [unclassified Companilactobacillus]|jgi:hypothetical protein|uniref:hypothetical protein n=1 Tax=unclassified Companilactobacillus TaxID=2767904 RepID=UPI002FF0E6F2
MSFFEKTIENLNKHLKSRVLKNFEPNNQIIALLDISNLDIPGNSFIISVTNGVYTDIRTTKQLMNQMYQSDGVGFEISKFLYPKFKLKQHLPYVNGRVAYMPMTGGSRQNTDWIGLHFIEDFEIFDKKIHFITTLDNKIVLDFPRGKIEERLHDIDIVRQAHLKILELKSKSWAAYLIYQKDKLMKLFDNCSCARHQKLREIANLQSLNDSHMDFLFSNIGIEGPVKEATKQHYKYNYQRIKKLF